MKKENTMLVITWTLLGLGFFYLILFFISDFNINYSVLAQVCLNTVFILASINLKE